MKQRKWWFIGLAFVLLAGSVVGWILIDWPPYRFLAGSKLMGSSIKPWFGADTMVREYRSNKSFNEIVELARQELEPLHCNRTQYDDSAIFSPYTNIDDIRPGWVLIEPTFADGGSVNIHVATRIPLNERVQMWFAKK